MPAAKRVQTRFHAAQILWGAILLLNGLFPQLGWAQATLENPQPNSFQSGIGVISGFVCTATLIVIEFDGTVTFEAAYGTSRGDTVEVCDDANNGFSLLFNWNLLDDGQHTVRALADGVEFASVTITVTTFGVEFLTGASGAFPLSGFPTPGTDITVRWQQPLQNFVITDGSAGSGGGNSGSGMQVLENPQPGSFQSGAGVISGFVCAATLIEIEFNGTATFEAAYGTSRGDTQGVCGDTNNGFGLLFNWNLLGNGVHTVRALADGVEFANVTITVTTFGVEFLPGANGEFTLPDFPEAGTDVVIQWQQPLQNFVITQVIPCEPGDLVCQGELTLGTGNLRDANVAFLQAAAANPTDSKANLYSAITRIVTTILDDPELTSLASSSKATSNLLKSVASRSGVVITGDSRDVCGMSLALPEEVPPGAPRTGEIIDTLRTVLLPEIVATLESLNRISSTAEIRFDLMNLPECLRPITERFEVEIDGSDIQALRAILQLVQAAFEVAAAYDLDADLQLVTTQTSRAILDAEPTLLNLLSSAPLTAARNVVEQALTNASMAIDSVFLETDDQSDDVLAILPEDTFDAERTRDTLDSVRQSLQGMVTLPTNIGLDEPERLNLSLFFSGSLGSLRPFIPVFDNTMCMATSIPVTLSGTLSSSDQESRFRARRGGGSSYFPLGRFPDPTFGGTTPDLTQQDINEEFLGGSPYFSDCYTFSGNAGQRVFIRLQSEEFDTFLFLVGTDGILVDDNDECSGDESNSCIPADTLQGGFLPLPRTGTYTVEVTSYFREETGTYSLTISEGN